jgi:hypothetical protein
VTRAVRTRAALGALLLVAGITALASRARGGGDEIAPATATRRPVSPGKLEVPGAVLRTGSSSVGKTGEVTRCVACHGVTGWEKVRFNHDPTGFPLRGAHQTVVCGGCHPNGFEVPVADTCAGCHRDRHGGEFGASCEGCHDDKSWRPLFQADAHRRTNFPLTGKHGLIPCQQCHGNMRDKSFGRAAVRCIACHQGDLDRTKVTSIDHAAAGFSPECQTCHGTSRFWPARLDQHAACFRIASGAHHGIRCLGCHTSLPAGASFTGTCATGTFTCSSCHAHSCPRSDTQHTNVMGYSCSDPKCYECHKLTGQ